MEEVKHYQVNGRYQVQFERGATKGVIGYKVEANGDDYKETFGEAVKLMQLATEATPSPLDIREK